MSENRQDTDPAPALLSGWSLEQLTAELRHRCEAYADLLGQVEDVRLDRDAFILELLDTHGLTQVEVARMADLSRSQVIRIVAREAG